MRNAEAWQAYVDYTQAASTNCRKLAFAAVAFAWVLRPSGGKFSIPVLIALGFLVIFFLADVLQYALAAELHRRWVRQEEVRLHRETGSIEGDYQKPATNDRFALSSFWIKVSAVGLAYASIGVALLVGPATS